MENLLRFRLLYSTILFTDTTSTPLQPILYKFLLEQFKNFGNSDINNEK